jgi:sorbitol-specific phosphotransferase system component IIBC
MKLFAQCAFVALVSAAGWGALFATLVSPVLGWVVGLVMAPSIFTIFWMAERGPVAQVEKMYRRRFDD